MISTGKVIYDLLSASTELAALVGTNIYPLLAPEDTPLPFVVYERLFINQNTKDGLATSKSNITILCISELYANSIDISTAVYNALLGEALLESGSESYENGAYIQTLNFTFWGI